MKQLTINSLLLAFCLLTNALYAQTTGKLFGKLIDEATNEPVMIAPLQLLKNGEQIATAESDFDGNYEFANIPVGRYELVCMPLGLPMIEVSNVRIDSGRICEYDIKFPKSEDLAFRIIYREMEIPLALVDNTFNTSRISLQVSILDKKTYAPINQHNAVLTTPELPRYNYEMTNILWEAPEVYKFYYLVPGVYTLKVQAAGYPTTIVQNIKIPNVPIGEDHEQFMVLLLDAEIPQDQVLVKKAVYMPKNN